MDSERRVGKNSIGLCMSVFRHDSDDSINGAFISKLTENSISSRSTIFPKNPFGDVKQSFDYRNSDFRPIIFCCTYLNNNLILVDFDPVKSVPEN